MTLTAKIRILDEVNCVVLGLQQEHLKYLREKFGVFAPNYFFHPKFKLGQWDGKIRFFHETGKTFVYLLEDVLPILGRFKYKCILEDLRKTNLVYPDPITNDLFANIKHLQTNEPIVLRDFQVEAVNELIKYGYGICVASTGSGKTLACCALVKAYDLKGVRSLTIVPDQTLIRQTKNEYINCQLDTGEYSGTHKNIDHKHVVSTWQALKNNPKIVSLFDMVIVDECHGLRGNVLSKILTDHAANIPYRFGFTGTLPKDESDRLAVHVAVGPVRYTIGAKDLIDKGLLSNLHINIIQLEEDMQEEYGRFCEENCVAVNPTYIQFKEQYFADFAAEKSYLQRNITRIEWIASYLSMIRDQNKGNILCLIDNIAFGRKLTDSIENAIFVNGQDVKKVNDRQEVYDLFKDRNDLIVIATVNIAGTGLNINRIFNLVIIDMGKSFVRVIQAIGRGLRLADDKNFVNIHDICSDLKYSKKHLRQRINYYTEAGYPFKKRKINYMKMMS